MRKLSAMKNTARILSIYASDTSGVCSMLYELGGLVVVHDASGCNSTYSTHDEPRWYGQDSMIYISALTETDMIFGGDGKLIGDTLEAIRTLSPRFAVLCGSPMPMLTGTDFDAVAAEVEARAGIPVLPLHTNGMRSYLSGASEALTALLRRFCSPEPGASRSGRIPVNILGATPLDFSRSEQIGSIRSILTSAGFEIVSVMAMGSTLEEIAGAGRARVNLVISSSGLAAAEYLRSKFGTPWVAGVPYGEKTSRALIGKLKESAESGENHAFCSDRTELDNGQGVLIVGESVSSGSLAKAVREDLGIPARAGIPEALQPVLAAPHDRILTDEDDAAFAFAESSGVAADPLFAPVCPESIPFYRLPHEAFSGRCFRERIPNLMGGGLTRRLFESC